MIFLGKFYIFVIKLSRKINPVVEVFEFIPIFTFHRPAVPELFGTLHLNQLIDLKSHFSQKEHFEVGCELLTWHQSSIFNFPITKSLMLFIMLDKVLADKRGRIFLVTKHPQLILLLLGNYIQQINHVKFSFVL